MSKTSERLRELRKQRNLKQREVATAVGISNALCSRYECDGLKPKTETLKKLAAYFSVSTDYLLGNEIVKVRISVKPHLAFIGRLEHRTYDIAIWENELDELHFAHYHLSKEKAKSILSEYSSAYAEGRIMFGFPNAEVLFQQIIN